MIYLVLGMHKSGTTLVSQTFHESGINMGDFDESLDYDNNNKFERLVTQEINRVMLDGFLLPPLSHLIRSRHRPLFDQAGYQRNKDSLALVRYQAFQREYQDYTPPVMKETVNRLDSENLDWGFKDPRTCLTYPIWGRVLPDHRLVIVYRHFSQLIKRYRVSTWNVSRLYRVLYSWTIHNKLIIRHLTQTAQQAIVLSYEKLMEDDLEYTRLQTFVGKKLVDARVSDLYRRRSEKSDGKFTGLIHLLSPLLPADPYKLYNLLETYRANGIA
jgi:hypothetical protein